MTNFCVVSGSPAARYPGIFDGGAPVRSGAQGVSGAGISNRASRIRTASNGRGTRPMAGGAVVRVVGMTDVGRVAHCGRQTTAAIGAVFQFGPATGDNLAHNTRITRDNGICMGAVAIVGDCRSMPGHGAVVGDDIAVGDAVTFGGAGDGVRTGGRNSLHSVRIFGFCRVMRDTEVEV